MRVLYFALVRERVGCGEEEFPCPKNVTTVAQLIDHLQARNDHYAAAFADLSAVRFAVNEDYVDVQHPVTDGDEIAFFPPMTGG